jgi:DNA-binding GntR family transcriptional regulator
MAARSTQGFDAEEQEAAMSNASERAYDEIRALIVAGEFRSGARLREEELSGIVGVSRTPVREALRRLSAEGMIEFLPHRGAHVASWTDQQLDEIFQLRALLESHGARNAAGLISAEDVATLYGLAERMEAHAEQGDDEGVEAISELNNEFHEVVAANAGSEQLVAFVRSLVQVPLVHRTFRRYSTRALQRSMAHHRELIEAFEARDPAWAEAVMLSHILAARQFLRASWSGPPDGTGDGNGSG